MKKSLIAGIAAVVMAIVALGAVFALDPARFRPLIESELARLAGRPVSIEGSIDISFVPGIAVVARDISVASNPDDAFELSVGEARVVLAWRNLLGGSAAASEVQLIKPRLTIGEASIAGLLARLAPPTAPASGAQGMRRASATRLRIEGGSIATTASATAAAVAVDHIRLDLTADGAAQRKISADFVMAGLRSEIEATLRAGREKDDISVDARFAIPEADLSGTAVGQATLASGAPLGVASYVGRGSISAGHLTEALALIGRLPSNDDVPPALNLPMTASAEIAGNARAFTLANIAIDLGGQTAKGKAEIAPDDRTFDVALMATALVADTWITAARPQKDASAPDRPGVESIGAFRDSPAWTGTVAISAPLFTAGGQTARDGEIQAKLVDGVWNIERAAATLPGQTKIDLAGFFRFDNGVGGIDGSWTLSALDPRGFLGWLGIDSAKVRTDRLSVLDARGTIQGTLRDIALGDVTIKLDNTTATGRIGFGNSERPTYRYQLAIDRLELDPYLPALLEPPAPDQTPRKVDAGYGVTAAPWALSALADFEADVRIEIAQLILGDVGAGTGAIDATLKSGRLNVRALSLKDVGGLSLFGSGVIEGLATVPTLRSVQVDLSAAEFSKINRAWTLGASADINVLFPLSATFTGNGPQLSTEVSLVGKAGDAEFRLSGTAAIVEDKPRVEVEGGISTTKTAAFLKAIAGLNLRPESPPLTLNGKVSYDTTSIAWEGVDAQLGDQRLTAAGKIEHKPNTQTFSLALENVSADIDSLLAQGGSAAAQSGADVPQWSKKAFKSFWPKTARGNIRISGPALRYHSVDINDFAATLSFDKNTMELSQWSGRVFGGATQLQVSLTNAPKPKLRAQVLIDDAEPGHVMSWLKTPGDGDGAVDIAFGLTADGASPQAWIEGLAGSGSFRFEALQRQRPSETRGPLAILMAPASATGATATRMVAGAAFRIADGVMNLQDGTMTSNIYGGSIRGDIDFKNWTMALAAQLRRQDPAAPGTGQSGLRLSAEGNIDEPTIKLNTLN